MISLLKNIPYSVYKVLVEFFSTDMDIISPYAKRLMSDRQNAEAYINGIKELRKKEDGGDPDPKVTIKLKNNKEIILSR